MSSPADRVVLPEELQARPAESLLLAVVVARAFAAAFPTPWLRVVGGWAPLPAWLGWVGAHVLAGGAARVRTDRGVAVLLLQVRGWRYLLSLLAWSVVVGAGLGAAAWLVRAAGQRAGPWGEVVGLGLAVAWAAAALAAMVAVWWRGERGCRPVAGAVRVEALAVWPPPAWPAVLTLWSALVEVVDAQQVVLQADARTERHAAAYRRVGFVTAPGAARPGCLYRRPSPQ